MNFISPEYLIGLPITLLVYQKLPLRVRWIWLLIVSIGFYFYWNQWTILLMMGVIGFTYYTGRMISRRRSRGWLMLTIVLLLGSLIWFKYLGLSDVMPVGISFYIFQALSYVLDLWRGETGVEVEENFGFYALYISFFPQLVAGPIERSKSLLSQFHYPAEVTRQDRIQGMRMIALGFFKKLVIADYLGTYVDAVYSKTVDVNGPMVALATVLFGLQIYCDFSGYSDIAIGSARLLGIRLMQNFHRPYTADSFRDFWHRWHISLTGWFTDYVYKPLGGSRCGTLRTMLNILIVFSLSGIWHGAGFTFLVWGLLHGIFLIIERMTGLHARWMTILGVSFAWIFFRADCMGTAIHFVRSLLTGWSGAGVTLMMTEMGLGVIPVLRILLSLLVLRQLSQKEELEAETPVITEESGNSQRFVSTDDTDIVFLLILVIGFGWLTLLSQNAGNTFIYFQF